MTNPQQQGNQGLDQYNKQYQDMTPWTHGGRYTSPEEALKQQLIAQGYDPNSQGFFDIFNNFLAQAKADAAATQQRTQQSQQLSQDVEFRTGLPAPEHLYQGVPHQQLKDMVQSVNPSQVTGVSSSWTQLANAMATFGQQLNQAANKSGATWKGDAAESAYNFVSGLGTWSDQSGQAAQLAADQVYSQSSAAETAKNSMPDPIPFSWTDEMKSWASSNPLDLVDNIDKSIQKQQQSQDAHDQAVQVMTSYDQNLYTAAAKAPAFNPPPTFEGPTGGTTGHLSGSIEGTSSAGYTGPSGNAVGNTNAVSGQGQSGSNSGSLSGSLSGLPTPVAPTLNSGIKTGGSISTPGKTSAQGFQPTSGSANSATTSGLGQAGLGPMGGMPMGAMGAGFGGMGDGDEYSSKLGRGGGGGFGPGGSAAGSGTASGASTGAGAQSGARAGGAGAAETAAGGAGARGAAGSSGRGGMGGMGHGGKGKGGEDEEHQRPSWLIEPDPDDVFGTTERTAPPVIGE